MGDKNNNKMTKPDTKIDSKLTTNRTTKSKLNSARSTTSIRPATAVKSTSARTITTASSRMQKQINSVPEKRLSKLSNYSSAENLTVDDNSIASANSSPRNKPSPRKTKV